MRSPHSEIASRNRAIRLHRDAEGAVFFGAWLRAPLRIASLVPSSEAMGRAFAYVADFDRAGDVLELGSGSGAISRGLLAAGLPAERLIMVERDSRLVAHSARHFPAARIVEADATEIDSVLERLDVRSLAAVVSTLPIVWFPLETQAAILAPCFDRLGEGGRFLQMTNFPRSPLPMRKLGIAGERVALVWRNLPPSFIWSYWRG